MLKATTLQSLGFLLLLVGFDVKATALEDLFVEVNPSVVIVNTESKAVSGDGKNRLVSVEGLGSGVVISADGKVLTAAHVVQASDYVSVEFLDGKVVPADILASVVAADVALLQLLDIPKNLVVAELGDSDTASVGAEIFVIGAPYGLSHTLTVGHISARHAPHAMMSGFELGEFLQTDAAVNQGNSGGPMFNMRGEVIAIVSHILSQSGGNEGLGFAVTSNIAKKLLMERKSFWSGLEGYRLPEKLARLLNVPQKTGLLVQRVAAHSLASRLGLKGGNIKVQLMSDDMLLGGDIILAVNGISIESKQSYEAILKSIKQMKSNELIQVKILRTGKILDLSTVI